MPKIRLQLTESELYEVIYKVTKETLRNLPLFEKTHIPRNLLGIGLVRMDERSINRILSHGQYGFVVISANRGSIENSNTELNMERQCTAELTIIFKTLLGEKISDEESKNAQYFGFDYRYKKLIDVFRKDSNISDLKTALDSPENKKEWLDVRNKWADKALLTDIQNKGYAWSKVYGGYHGKDDAIDSYEPSYVVYNHDRKITSYGEWEDLYNFAIEMCGKYNQESVYIQAPNEAPIWVNNKGQVVSTRSSKNFKINREEEEFYTTDKRKKNSPHRFTADITSEGKVNESIHFENYLTVVGPATYNGRIRRRFFGEIFLDE